MPELYCSALLKEEERLQKCSWQGMGRGLEERTEENGS